MSISGEHEFIEIKLNVGCEKRKASKEVWGGRRLPNR
jgi:hypothetical protein